MLQKLYAVLGLALIVFGASAQDAACSILTFSARPNEGGYTVTIHQPDDDAYTLAATLTETMAQAVFESRRANEHVQLALDIADDVRGTRLDLYAVAPGGFFHFDQLMLDDLLPYHNGWSSSGRYLALHEINRPQADGMLLLVIHDTETGTQIPHGAVVAEFGVSWSPRLDALAYVTADGIYAADAAGRSLWSAVRDVNTDTHLRWLSATELAVVTCGETCTARIGNVSSGDERLIDFGEYLPEAYLAWRDSYIVTRASDGAVGLWNAATGFRPYTGRNSVTSRPTLTSDGRHLSVRIAQPDGQAGVLVGDLLDSKLWYTLPLRSTPEAAIDAPFGDWNVREQKFLYTDAGSAYVYDAMANDIVAVIEDATTAQWVCPERH